MAVIYVAKSAIVSEWSSDVGLGKNAFMLGVADSADDALAELNKGVCGATDWEVVTSGDAGGATVDQVIARVSKKEKLIDPKLYPRLRGVMGLFRVKQDNVENHVLVKKALDGGQISGIKIKPADFAAYLLVNAK